jgi:UDP-N-acetylglucosamine 2-epimerase (non-hydrolysing)
MLAHIFSFFEIEPDIKLNLMTHNQSLSQITALLFTHLDVAIKDVDPALIIVQGDTPSPGL